MKNIFSYLVFCAWFAILQAQAVYVDSNTGDDKNPGTKKAPVLSIKKGAEIIKSPSNNIYTMKINPGLYLLDRHISVETKKKIAGKRIVIEAAVLPDDTSWRPEKMPVIISRSKPGEIIEPNLFIKDNWITSFNINASNVTIRGLKFPGHHYPVNFYYPISRFNKAVTDLSVEQCVFAADPQSSVIQVGVIARGNSVKVDHCIFYHTNNGVIFWQNSGNDFKTGNSVTHCIFHGSSGTALWTDSPERDFLFKNNIVANCNFFWIKEDSAAGRYSLENCLIVNNRYYMGDGNLNPADYARDETNVTKEGDISLRMIKTVWEPWPIDHLHVIPNTPGYDIRAGLFKQKKL